MADELGLWLCSSVYWHLVKEAGEALVVSGGKSLWNSDRSNLMARESFAVITSRQRDRPTVSIYSKIGLYTVRNWIAVASIIHAE